MVLNSDTIEVLSTNAVKNSIVKCSNLSPFINSNDKEPSWDGHIYCYKNKNHNKSSLVGRVPVQIKGKKVCIKKPKKEIQYPMKVSDLNNYLKDGGVILFVVYIDDNSHTKIYYRELTVIRLRSLLESKNKSTKSIKLIEFPEENNKKSIIIHNFLMNREKQYSSQNVNLINFEDINNCKEIEEIKIPFMAMDKNNPIQELLEGDVYFYVKVKGCNVVQPVNVTLEEIFVTKIVNTDIKVGSKVFYNSYELEKSKSNTRIKIGESLIITISADNNENRIEYTTSGLVRILANDLDFFLNVLKEGSFQMGDEIVKINIDRKVDFFKQEKNLLYAKRIVEVLNKLNCKSDLNLKELSEKDMRMLDILYKSLIKKEMLFDLPDNAPCVAWIRIADLKFLIIFEKNEINGKEGYYLYDFFNRKIQAWINEDNDECRFVSQFSILNNENLLDIGNFQTSNLINDFKSKQTDDDFNLPIRFLLSLLRAYDLSESKRKDLLELSLEFAEWIKHADKINKSFNIINYLQVVKRKRKLSDQEMSMLWDIIEDTASTDSCKLGAYLLLDQQKQAERYFNKITSEEKKEMMNFPIWKFWKKEIQ